MRLIDADNLGVKKLSNIGVTTTFAYGWNSALNAVKDDSPSIDPETLPIVKQLWEELKQVTVERDDLKETVRRLASMQMTIKEAKDDHLLYYRHFFEYGDWLSNADVKEIAAILLNELVEADEKRRKGNEK